MKNIYISQYNNIDKFINIMDVFLIIIMCVVGILLMIVNIYLLALYCHPEDGGFGASLFCKIVVVIPLFSLRFLD